VLLFDTGFGSGNRALDDRYHPRPVRLADALVSIGAKLHDVEAVVNCHLHADHAGQNAAFRGTPIYVQSIEWQLAHTTDHTVLEWIDFNGANYRMLDGDHRLEAEVTILSTPGHTPGHQSLAVQTPDGLVILAGQACYTAAEWASRPTRLEGRTTAPDRRAYDRSLARLRDLDPVRVHFGHDREVWSA
jgi:glyoxylase-like metal-dependent hydrolase (beta-lactamase superfamily II)